MHPNRPWILLLAALVSLSTLTGCEEIRRLINTPEVSFISPTNGSTVEEDTVMIRGVVQDTQGLTALTVTLNGGAAQDIFNSLNPATNQFEFELDGLVVGNNAIAVAATNVRGYTGNGLLTLRRLGEGPQIVISNPEEGFETEADAITVSGTITSDSTLTRAQLTLNNGSPINLLDNLGDNGSFSVDVSGLAVGSNTISITARDNAQSSQTINRTVVRTETVTPDPLAVTVLSPTEGAEIPEGDVDLSATFSGDLDGLQISLRLNEGDDEDVTSGLGEEGAFAWTLEALEAGPWTATLTATNGAEETVSASVSFTVTEEDETPILPTFTFVSPAAGSTVETASVTVEGTLESDVAITEASWRLDDGEENALDIAEAVTEGADTQTVSFAAAGLTNGARTLHVTLTLEDDTSFTSSVNFIVQLPPPPACDSELFNGDFEEPMGIAGIVGWITNDAVVLDTYANDSRFDAVFFEAYPELGTSFVAGTVPVDDAPAALLSQDIDLSALEAEVDAEALSLDVGGWFGGLGGNADTAVLEILFVDGEANITSTTIAPFDEDTAAGQPWALRADELLAIPAGTRLISLEITFTDDVETGTFPGFVDSVWAALRDADSACVTLPSDQ